MINWVYIFFFYLSNPLNYKQTQGSFWTRCAVCMLIAEAASALGGFTARSGTRLPISRSPVRSAGRRPLPDPWLFKGILPLSPSLGKGILGAQPPDCHLWTCWSSCSVTDVSLGASWYLCSLVNVVDLEMVVNASVSKENTKTCQNVHFVSAY